MAGCGAGKAGEGKTSRPCLPSLGARVKGGHGWCACALTRRGQQGALWPHL